MCRLLAYLGPALQLDRILTKPEHSLIVQSYQPQEMTAGLLNADGYGIGWYHPHQSVDPFTYKSLLPIWSDVNLSSLSRYVESNCVLACVRSASEGIAVDLSNCQPFRAGQILGIHNGLIDRFRQTLCRPIQEQLIDTAYQSIQGTTDSEHMFALAIDQLERQPDLTLDRGLYQALRILMDLAAQHQVKMSANFILSDGKQLVASRYSQGTETPSLYWLRDDPSFPDAVIIASEPLFAGAWNAIPERSILTVDEHQDVQLYAL